MKKTEEQKIPPIPAIEPPAYTTSHRCREWRLNVYRKWKKTHQEAK
jgi:hypothetical protein